MSEHIPLCPFCGDKAHTLSSAVWSEDRSRATTVWWVVCTTCGARTADKPTEWQARDAWRRRNQAGGPP